MAMGEREIALVVSAKGGDSKAFEELYNFYYSKIFALARTTLRNESDAEDILQQSFISAWRNLHSLINPEGFNTWLQKITLNNCYSLLRKKNITILLDADSDIDNFGEDISDELLPAIYAERDDLRKRLGKIIDSLSDVQKQTIVLYYFNEQKVEEIAYIMECNVSTVKTRLFLARKAIRSEVEEEERRSGEKFYGIIGIPMLPFGDMLAQYIQSQMLSIEASTSMLVHVREALSQGVSGDWRQGVSGNVQVVSNGIQVMPLTTSAVKNTVIAGLSFPIKIIAIAGLLALCIGFIFMGVQFFSNTDNGNSSANDEYNNTDNELVVSTAPSSSPTPTPESTPAPDEQLQEQEDILFAIAKAFSPQNSISAGISGAVGVRMDGTVTGSYEYEEVGNWTDIVAVSSSRGLIVGLKTDGTVVAVGETGGRRGTSEMLNVGDWTDIISVAAGGGQAGAHTVGLKSDGTVVAAGRQGTSSINVGKWTDIIAIAGGGSHTVGLKADGTVVITGDGTFGARNDLPDGVVAADDGGSNVDGWTNIIAISAGELHTVGLRADGTVVAVGSNNEGQINVGGWANIIAISAGELYTLGLKSDGTVVGTGARWRDGLLSDWTNIIAISAGGLHAEGAIGLRADGTVITAQGKQLDWTDIRITPP